MAAAEAREEAEQALAAIHAEIAEMRRELLARETLTESRLDEAMARIEQRLAAIPGGGAAASRRAGRRRGGVAGRRTRLHAIGWVGTIAAVDIGRGRATLAAGGSPRRGTAGRAGSW